jgi:hypothetical protein
LSQLKTYRNGNYLVKIFESGTRIRETDAGVWLPDQPDNIDCKITNYCDNLHCVKYCHEKSNLLGQHGDVDLGLSVLSQLRGGEVAIGGGSTLSHPKAKWFLEQIKNQTNLIANITVNQYHLEEQLDLINELAAEELFCGLGLSYIRLPFDFARRIKAKQVIWHLIIGIHTPEDAKLIIDNFDNPNILLLGYKEYGRGINFYSRNKEQIDSGILSWYRRLHEFFEYKKIATEYKNTTIAFDNLAIRQLGVKRFFDIDSWNKFYQGDDGHASMYLDLVKKEFAMSSRSTKRFPLTNGMNFSKMLEQCGNSI